MSGVHANVLPHNGKQQGDTFSQQLFELYHRANVIYEDQHVQTKPRLLKKKGHFENPDWPTCNHLFGNPVFLAAKHFEAMK